MKIEGEFEYLKKFFSPYSKRVYLVGGCVRDEFLGIESKEFDIEVYDIDINKFDELMKKLKAKGVGKSFFVYKWKNFDISLPRIENKIAKGHRGFEVKLTQDEKFAAILLQLPNYKNIKTLFDNGFAFEIDLILLNVILKSIVGDLLQKKTQYLNYLMLWANSGSFINKGY